MDCSCHEPAVFGHLECDLAPPGLVTGYAADRRIAARQQKRMARLTLSAERKREILRRLESMYCRTHDLYACPYNH